MNHIETIRHSLSHLTAMAVKDIFKNVRLGIGPTIENGFYYDFLLDTDSHRSKDPSKCLRTIRLRQIAESDLVKIEKKMRELIDQKIDFIKEEISIGEAKKLFKDEPFKLELISEMQERGLKKVSIYQSAEFIDLCRGPHVKNTSEIPFDAFKLTRLAGAYWKGQENKPQLQRIYGIAFENKTKLKEYFLLQKETEKRDHRKLGKALGLFFFAKEMPGAPIWLPRGMVVFKELEKIWRRFHESAGYQEISTPILAKKELWEKSGHWKYYQENMYNLEADNQIFSLKPMNCPESTFVYNTDIRSYKDLPLRFSEIGRLHRKERSGTLTGLFRVIQLTMDDAHIYCRQDQIQEEILGVLELVKKFYQLFDFKPCFNLSTRGEKAMGAKELWSKAEDALKNALKKAMLAYELKPGDAAFYGPKIDIHIEDCLHRSWQIATIQLDFQMPERFGLFYINQGGAKQKPVIIHRAIFGSFERFIGILTEHYAGAFPFWLAPLQIQILPIADRHINYAKEILAEIEKAGLRAEVNFKNETVSKKIREGELQKIPYLLVVGDKEEKNRTVRIRERARGDIGEKKLEEFIKIVDELISK